MAVRSRAVRNRVPVPIQFGKQAALGAGVANTVKQDYWIAPCAGRVVGLQGAASTIAGAVKPTLSIWKGATRMTDEKTMTTALTVYRLTPLNGSREFKVAKGDHLVMRATTNAGDGVLTNPTIMGLFEPSPGRNTNPNAIYPKLYYPGALGAGVALTTITDTWFAPCDGRIDAIYVIGQGKAGGTDPKLQVKRNGSTAVCTAVDIAADDTVYTAVLTESERRVSRGDRLSLVAETAAVAGELVNPTIIIEFVAKVARKRSLMLRMGKSGTALGAGVLSSVVQDLIILPQDLRRRGMWLKSAFLGQSARAGFTAEKAYLDMAAAGLTNLDTVFEAHTAGYASRLKQIQVIGDATGLKASLDMSTLSTAVDTVIEAAAAGTAGDAWKILLIPGAAAKAGIANEDTTKKVFTFIYQDGVSDVDDFETVITAAANLAVKTGGTGANVLNDPADTSYVGQLSGGTAVTYVDIVGGLLMRIHFTDGVSTVTNVETEVAALSGADDIIDTKTGGTGANVLADPGDVLAATNLANGTDANPTYDIYKEDGSPASILTLPTTATADDTRLPMTLEGGGNERVKLANEDMLSLRATTLPTTGESANPAVELELEW